MLRLPFVLCVTFMVGTSLARATDCSPLSKNAPERITRYLQQRLVSGQNAAPSIISAATIPETCYRKLTIRIPGVSHVVVMYLSPDERFLSSSLYDLSEDPQKTVAATAQTVSALLMREQSPQRGSGKTITIVEFGDQQCPFCRQLQQWYLSLPESLRTQTTLVFKHLPLERHSWSKPAALYAACAGLESDSAFWHLADFILEHQDEITPQNLENKLLHDVPEIDTARLASCAANGNGAQVVERDLEVAKQLNVTGTPTLFINGLRTLPVHSPAEFRQLLERVVRQDSKPELVRKDGTL